jgi:hypothetical protein
VARDDEAPREGFLRRLLSDYRAFASLVGLLVYGVVRVAYDAYYTRLGVFPEAVGLSETTILGRAALYLALTVSIAAIFGGIWLMAVGGSIEQRRRPRPRDPARRRRRDPVTPSTLFGATAVLAVLAAGVVSLGGSFRSLLGSYHLAYFCVLRCKFTVLTPTSFQQVETTVQEHPGSRFTDVGPAWLVAVPLALLLAAAAVGLVAARRGRWSANRVGPYAVFGLLAAASLLAGLAAPHVIAVSENAANAGSGFVDDNPGSVKWVVFLLVLGAVFAGLLAALELLAGAAPKRSPWLIASFIAVIPLMLGFMSPTVPLFIEDEGGSALAAAVVLWLALMAVTFWLWPNPREARFRNMAGLGGIVALIVTLTLYLAWERGTNLAKQAAMGDQIFAKRFSLLSVRANVVCLDPQEEGTKLAFRRRPYVYLGEAGGTLVLYDYVVDRANETPTAFPVRMSSSAVVVRLAHYAPHGPKRIQWVNWDCSQNA